MTFAKRLTGKVLAVACTCVLAVSVTAAPAFAEPAAEGDGSPAQGQATTDRADASGATTYQVVLYAGNQGTVKAAGAEEGSDRVALADADLGDKVDFTGITVEVPANSKYYAKGVRLAALDNVRSDNIHGDTPVATIYYARPNDKGELVNDAQADRTITEDTDFVVAYGILANRVAYTVTYTDTEGNQIAEPQRFYGDIGDRPAVAAAYIEGYVPRVDVRLQTLTANEADNVFPFVYTRLAQGTTTTPNPGGGVDIRLPNGVTVPDAYTTVVTPTGVQAAEANPVPAPVPGAGLVPAEEGAPMVAPDGTEVLADDGTPLTQPTQESIEDDGAALANGVSQQSQPGSQQDAVDRAWMPWAIAAVILAAAIVFILVRGRRRDDEDEETAAA